MKNPLKRIKTESGQIAELMLFLLFFITCICLGGMMLGVDWQCTLDEAYLCWH